MKKQGIRKHALLKEEIDSVNEKLKKFTELDKIYVPKTFF
jgi:hypothetical protein